MPDYSHAKIYAIRAPDSDDVYIGSTVKKYLSSRLAQHRNQFKNWKDGKEHFRWSFKMIEKPGHYIELVEKFSCNSIEELRKREGELIKTTAGCINWYVAGRSDKEYADEHKEDNSKRCREWYEKNREIVLEKERERRAKKKALASQDGLPPTHIHPVQEQ